MNQSIDIDYMPVKTKEVFEILSKQSFISNYTLIGGTALSIQVKHRLSEDLDFIADEETININSIKRNIGKIFPGYKVIRQDDNWQIDLVVNDIKITFFSTGSVAVPFNVGKHSFEYKNMKIGYTTVIASLKMAAIAQRNAIRDYYDLYWLARYHHSLLDIINQTKILIPALSPITYSETLIYTEDIDEKDISEHLKPKEVINKDQIAEYFTKELKKIKRQI